MKRQRWREGGSCLSPEKVQQLGDGRRWSWSSSKSLWKGQEGKRDRASLSKHPEVQESPEMSRTDPLHPQCRAVSAADSSLPARDGLVSAALTARGRNSLLLLSLVNPDSSSCLLSSPSRAVFMLHPIAMAVCLLECCSGDKALSSMS